jgi:hypothetical protein
MPVGKGRLTSWAALDAASDAASRVIDHFVLIAIFLSSKR